MGVHRTLRRGLAAGGIAALAAVLAAAPAAAVDGQPDGIWAPFDRCPLHDPIMQAPEAFNALCVVSATERNSGGKFRIRGTTTPVTGASNVQFGASGRQEGDVQTILTVSGPNPIVAEHNVVPGGLLGIATEQGLKRLLSIVPGGARLVDAVNIVTATLEPAGPVTDFDFLAALTGTPVIRLPVKIHLQHPLLGPNCYIGSNANPIVLRPQTGTTSPPPPNAPITGDPGELEFLMDPDAPDGVAVIVAHDQTLVDNSFGVPAARGCGLLNLLDSAINQRMGLPSPPGNNEIVLPKTTARIGGAVPVGDQTAYEILAAEIAEG